MHLPIVLDNHFCERYYPLFVLIYLTTKKNKRKKKERKDGHARQPLPFLVPGEVAYVKSLAVHWNGIIWPMEKLEKYSNKERSIRESAHKV